MGNGLLWSEDVTGKNIFGGGGGGKKFPLTCLNE